MAKGIPQRIMEDGLPWYLHGTSTLKSSSVSAAAALRAKGDRTRIRKIGDRWVIYRRKK